MKRYGIYVLWGLGFGFIISRAGAVRFDYIRDMFLFKSAQLYFVIGGAIAVALPLFWWLQRREARAKKGAKKLPWPHRRMTAGTLPGAAIFGIGWAITGTCPSTSLSQIGEGHWYALATVLGALLGNYIFYLVRPTFFGDVETCG